MHSPIAVSVIPFFLETPRGCLFAVHRRPRDVAPWRGQVLCIPPFNEEMNRSRSMLTRLAQTLAGQGFGVLLLDLHGTGDSAGEYHEARWDGWLDDIYIAREWLNLQSGGGVCAFLGMRLGAILATQVYVKGDVAKTLLLLWQPVIEGKSHFTQFLRIRMAAQLDRADALKESTNKMRQHLAGGKILEVAGYAIHPALAMAIDEAVLLDQSLPVGARVLWLEQSKQPLSELTPNSRRVLEIWNKPGIKLDVMAYADPPFWQVHERVDTPELITKTSDWLLEQAIEP